MLEAHGILIADRCAARTRTLFFLTAGPQCASSDLLLLVGTQEGSVREVHAIQDAAACKTAAA